MLFTILVSAGLIGIDQIIKAVVVHNLAPNGAVTLIPGLLEFRYLENDGAAFNLLAGRQTLLVVVTGLALLVVAYILLFRRPKAKIEYLSVMLIFAGGVGNLIDRIANGYVVDYISLLFIDFAIFNFADCLVVVGFALLIVSVFVAEAKSRKKEKQLVVEEDQPLAEMKEKQDGPAVEDGADGTD